MSPSGAAERYRAAAAAYLGYAIVYWIGGVYLVWHGVGVPGPPTPGKRAAYVAFWLVMGAVPTLVIPYLLRQPRAWFERWLLTRRDFARLLALVMAWRAWVVLRVAVRPDTATVPAPWDGELTFRAGAIVFFLVTTVALALVARAAWASQQARA